MEGHQVALDIRARLLPIAVQAWMSLRHDNALAAGDHELCSSDAKDGGRRDLQRARVAKDLPLVIKAAARQAQTRPERSGLT